MDFKNRGKIIIATQIIKHLLRIKDLYIVSLLLLLPYLTWKQPSNSSLPILSLHEDTGLRDVEQLADSPTDCVVWTLAILSKAWVSTMPHHLPYLD